MKRNKQREQQLPWRDVVAALAGVLRFVCCSGGSFFRSLHSSSGGRGHRRRPDRVERALGGDRGGGRMRRSCGSRAGEHLDLRAHGGGRARRSHRPRGGRSRGGRSRLPAHVSPQGPVLLLVIAVAVIVVNLWYTTFSVGGRAAYDVNGAEVPSFSQQLQGTVPSQIAGSTMRGSSGCTSSYGPGRPTIRPSTVL